MWVGEWKNKKEKKEMSENVGRGVAAKLRLIPGK